MNNKYILLRHGETKYQAEKSDLLYTQEDQFSLPITPKGQERIRQAAEELKNKKIDLICSSDFFRTKQTAEIVKNQIGCEIIYDQRLRDTDMGIFKGKTSGEYQTFLEKDKFKIKPPEGESLEEVKERATAAIKDLEKKFEDKIILIVSHGDPVWLLLSFFGYPDTYLETGQYFDLTDL